ncbi:MAG: GAF domain-containing protein [Rhodospirillaceae bacterium]|nr:GAF domain-containing protein [Rhodospirillales bacterium]
MELPPNEAERLAALINYGILDTEFDESFDRITRIAATIFGVPIALISLLDGQRQWFKSAFGLEVRETPRNISFCTHAILGTDVLVVPDATADRRFSANPLVMCAPNIRFYAGAPLMTPDGYALGTMCIIDRRSREALDEHETQTLKDLSGMVIDMMEFRKAKRQRARETKPRP